MHGFIEADDGGTIMVDYGGYGRVHGDSDAEGRRQVVGATCRLNEPSAPFRERSGPSIPPEKITQADVRLVFDVAGILWEKLPE